MNVFYVLNLSAIFFLLFVSIIFYFYSISKLIKVRDYFHESLNLSDIISIKIDYNGIVLNYSDNFFTLFEGGSKIEDYRGLQLLDIIKLASNEDTIFMSFINKLDTQTVADTHIKFIIDGEEKIFFLKGTMTKSINGVSEKYSLIIKEITEEVNLLKESIALKEKNKGLYSELAAIEEEVQRNFEQLNERDKDIVNIAGKHQLVINSLDIGILEYDFSLRELNFSQVFATQIFGAERKNISEDDILNYFRSILSLEDYTRFLSSVYETLFKKEEFFSISLHLKNINKVILLEGRAYFKGDDPYYFVCYSRISEK